MPARVKAISTTRFGGVSRSPWNEMNLGLHVGDDRESVLQNRARLREELGLKNEPVWLNQVHGVEVVPADTTKGIVDADASFTCRTDTPCVVMTADCLPVLFADVGGQCVAAAHAGWRGLLDGVLEATVSSMPLEPSQILAWLGPAIGPTAFEVGDEVYSRFLAHSLQSEIAFTPGTTGKWMMDIYKLARLRLADAGVSQIYGGDWCTYSDKIDERGKPGDEPRFFSYRRDQQTGRMASLIWME